MANNNGNGKSLESWIWDAACSIRGAKDAPKYKDFILPLIFTKRLCDVFEKGYFSRVGRDRSYARGTYMVKAGVFINNYIPDEDIERMRTGDQGRIRRYRSPGLPENT